MDREGFIAYVRLLGFQLIDAQVECNFASRLLVHQTDGKAIHISVVDTDELGLDKTFSQKIRTRALSLISNPKFQSASRLIGFSIKEEINSKIAIMTADVEAIEQPFLRYQGIPCRSRMELLSRLTELVAAAAVLRDLSVANLHHGLLSMDKWRKQGGDPSFQDSGSLVLLDLAWEPLHVVLRTQDVLSMKKAELLAPEIFRQGYDVVDIGPLDVFAFGFAIVMTLTGAYPWEPPFGESPAALERYRTMAMEGRLPLPSLSHLEPLGLPSKVTELIRRCFDDSPQRRPSALELHDGLRLGIVDGSHQMHSADFEADFVEVDGTSSGGRSADSSNVGTPVRPSEIKTCGSCGAPRIASIPWFECTKCVSGYQFCENCMEGGEAEASHPTSSHALQVEPVYPVGEGDDQTVNPDDSIRGGRLTPRERTLADTLGHVPSSCVATRLLRRSSGSGQLAAAASPIQPELSADDLIMQAISENSDSLGLFDLRLRIVPSNLFVKANAERITDIDLSSNEIEILPDAIGDFYHLRRLKLGSNRLIRLSSSLGRCIQLSHLSVNNNALEDLPDELANCNVLETLEVDFNQLTRLPRFLGRAKATPSRLREILASGNVKIEELPGSEYFAGMHAVTLTLDNHPHVVAQWRLHLQPSLPPQSVTIAWTPVFPDKILPDLYLGPLRTTFGPHVYDCLGIACVLTVGRNLDALVPKHVFHSTFNIDDLPGCRIPLREVAQQIATCCEKGPTLVHCYAGISRSATAVLAFLMCHRQMPLPQAVALVKQERPCIRPNRGFWTQLKELHLQLFQVALPVDVDTLLD